MSCPNTAAVDHPVAERARRRSDPMGGPAVVAAPVEHTFVFDNPDDVPVVVFDDSLWRVIDLRFLGSRFGTTFADRLVAVVGKRVCVSARPWFETVAAATKEINGYSGPLAERTWGGALLVESKLPRYRSPWAALYPEIIPWLERLANATVDGRCSAATRRR
jgi:hypothetical protein